MGVYFRKGFLAFFSCKLHTWSEVSLYWCHSEPAVQSYSSTFDTAFWPVEPYRNFFLPKTIFILKGAIVLIMSEMLEGYYQLIAVPKRLEIFRTAVTYWLSSQVCVSVFDVQHVDTKQNFEVFHMVLLLLWDTSTFMLTTPCWQL